MSTSATPPTTPDLVLLSLLTEQNWHGYELNAELERREVRDWAGISRPQVYYSLRKLAESRLIETVDGGVSNGPERQVYRIMPAGRQALSKALEREDWATQRPPPPFLTWLALSGHADPRTIKQMISKRETFLKAELERERESLQGIRSDAGAMVEVAELMVTFTISSIKSELRWLREVRSTLLDRGD